MECYASMKGKILTPVRQLYGVSRGRMSVQPHSVNPIGEALRCQGIKFPAILACFGFNTRQREQLDG